MALQFNPPEWLLQDYINQQNKNPVVEGLQGASQVMQQYAQQKLQKDEVANKAKDRKVANFNAIKDFLPEDQIASAAQEAGIDFPPPVTSSATVPSPTAGIAGSVGEPVTQAPSPLVQARLKATGQIPTSKAGLAKYKTNLETQKLQKDVSSGPDSLEKILAQKVASGEMTLEQAYKQKAKGSPAVAGGKPPAGFRWTVDGNLEAIPGGPAGLKLDEKSKKEQGLKDAAIAQADTVITKVDQAMKNVSGWTTGVGGSIMGKVPGSSAVDLEKDIDTIKANLSFATLQEMRRNSPTGGALGQIAVRELDLLGSTVASLDRSQSKGQLQQHLQEVKKHYEKWKETVQEESGGGSSSPEPVSALAHLSTKELQDLRKKMTAHESNGN